MPCGWLGGDLNRGRGFKTKRCVKWLQRRWVSALRSPHLNAHRMNAWGFCGGTHDLHTTTYAIDGLGACATRIASFSSVPRDSGKLKLRSIFQDSRINPQIPLENGRWILTRSQAAKTPQHGEQRPACNSVLLKACFKDSRSLV